MSAASWLEEARAMMSDLPLARAMGLEVVHIGERDARLAFTVRKQHLNYLGGLHGGVLATLMDTAAFFPGSLLPSGRKYTTVNVNVAFYRGVEEGVRVVAAAEISHLGRRTAHVDVSAHDPDGNRVARAQVGLLALP